MYNLSKRANYDVGRNFSFPQLRTRQMNLGIILMYDILISLKKCVVFGVLKYFLNSAKLNYLNCYKLSIKGLLRMIIIAK